jgi:hypothetical protein
MMVSPSKCRDFTPHLSNKTALHSRSRVFDAFVGPRPQAYPPHQCYRKDDAPCVTNLEFARGAAAKASCSHAELLRSMHSTGKRRCSNHCSKTTRFSKASRPELMSPCQLVRKPRHWKLSDGGSPPGGNTSTTHLNEHELLSLR